MKTELSKLAWEHANSRTGDGPLTRQKEFEQKFFDLIVDACCDAIIDCDPSEKMILHEPYRIIMNHVKDCMYDLD